MARLGETELDVSRLCLGGNVFGWTADEAASFAVLDAYVDAGGNFVDTADSYSAWLPGHQGGESEAVIGRWMTARGNRDRLVIATKVAQKPDRKGLSAGNIAAAAEESLARLQTDRIDLYYAHVDDPETPLEETLQAFTTLIDDGKVRHAAASNYSSDRLSEALRISQRDGLTRYVALQMQYSLVERDGYERELREVCEREGLPIFPYWVLAAGFLTGKYRPGGVAVDSPRAGSAGRYLEDPRALTVLEALDEIAAAHDTTVSAVALAWTAAQPTVLAPIASARDTEQLAGLLPMLELELTAAERERLDAASSVTAT
jgi:aryl-alcohol dehydrogenase-like predicted oxidoreductase